MHCFRHGFSRFNKQYICSSKNIRMKYFKSLVVLAVFTCFSFSGKAWGVLGHRIVGEIADSYLTKHTKREIAKILGNESVAMSSNWGDFIKSDPAYKYLYNWHFADIPSGMTEQQVLAYFATDTVTDAYTKINFMVNELKNNRAVLSNEMKQLYLRMIIHIVGDVHQPFHVGRPEDKGGNTIKLKWFDDASNLHQVWDEKLINFQQLSYTEYARAINFTTKDQRREWQSQPLAQWLADSYALAEKIYPDVKADQRLDYLYNFKYIGILNQQLLKGGVHLAGLLNDIFS